MSISVLDLETGDIITAEFRVLGTSYPNLKDCFVRATPKGDPGQSVRIPICDVRSVEERPVATGQTVSDTNGRVGSVKCIHGDLAWVVFVDDSPETIFTSELTRMPRDGNAEG